MEVQIQQRLDGYFEVIARIKRCVGILRSTNELSLTIDYLRGCKNLMIIDGWEIGAGGDWTWTKGEEELLEEMHPGLIEKIVDLCEQELKTATPI